MLPMLIVFLVQTEVSLKRINEFLNADELDLNSVSHEEHDGKKVFIRGGEFSWDKEADPFLRNINLTVNDGELVAVVGTVGSGKSSLLSGLLGEV